MSEMKDRLHRMAREAMAREDLLESARSIPQPLYARQAEPEEPAADTAAPGESRWEELVEQLDLALARRSREEGRL